MEKRCKTIKSEHKAACLQKEELMFWERQNKSGDEVDLKLARDLPDDTPEFILRMLIDFEKDAAKFCFSGAKGRILDAGCGNGNLAQRALRDETTEMDAVQFIGMDFSRNMLSRAAFRAKEDPKASFLQGSITHLPFRDQSFDWIACSGVLTCLPTLREAKEALGEFSRVLGPGGILVVDFFNRISHYTLVRRYLFGGTINPPEYVSPSQFKKDLDSAGFLVLEYRGFDFKPCQGYLFMSRWRPLIDPCFIQERLSQLLERKVVAHRPELSLLGYRIFVKCVKK